MSYLRPFDITDHPDYAREEDNLKCDHCAGRNEAPHMVRHEDSGMVICKTCVQAFTLTLCDGDELNPKFIDL